MATKNKANFVDFLNCIKSYQFCGHCGEANPADIYYNFCIPNSCCGVAYVIHKTCARKYYRDNSVRQDCPELTSCLTCSNL